ncbi:hypothetical protein [Actinacidiphila yanglinensis]|uniref:hypothetical protein n=1 Tax=Actinacidiphila yanglinensis TaxID=310779 RepID=UPI001F2C8AF5|nr:hypothetical protein [Actinacidiphila yanglinensis]
MRTRKTLVVLAVAGLTLLATGGPARAGDAPAPGVGAGSGDGNISASAAAYQVTYTPAEPPKGHPLTANTGWTPPACWQAPVATPKELKAERESVWGEDSTGYEWDSTQRDYYVNGHPHKDFEIPNTGKGMWWNGQANPNRIGDPGALSCFKEYDDWVLNGDTPPAPKGPIVTPEILAESAYDRIRIPENPITLSPSANDVQTVNLNTWAWLDKGDVAPVSVTARLASLNLWATTTATPEGLHLRAGTPDADLYPASGDCPLNADGSIGEKYVKADGNKVPPCGLTYRRSSDGGTFPLSATISWKVSWTGSGGTGGDLAGGSFEFDQDVQVQEIQSVNH